MSKRAFVDAAGLLTAWGFVDANGTDTPIPVDDDFAAVPGSQRWDGTQWTAVTADPAPPSLADRLGALAAERYGRQTAGVMFQAAGASAASRAASDPVSTGMLTASYVAARDGHWVDGTPWKMVDGTFVPLTAADMQALALRVLGYIAACFAHEGQLAAQLGHDLTSDITAGWPDPTAGGPSA